MSKIIKEISMGDYVVTLKNSSNGDLQAKLSSASHGRILKVEKLKTGHLKLREMDIGSAEITVEHLALLLTLIGLQDELIKELNKINLFTK